MRYEDLRRRLETWSVDRLVDLVMDLAQSDWELHRRIDRHVIAREDPDATSASLRGAIDLALAVRFVEWDEVASFVTRLDAVVADIAAFGRDHPAPALELLRYFVVKLPSVFDNVHGEDELSQVCEDLAAQSVKLASRAGLPLRGAVEPLLRAYGDDGYGYFDRVPEAVARELREAPEDVRAELADCAMEVAGETRDSHVAKRLEGWARQMRADGGRMEGRR